MFSNLAFVGNRTRPAKSQHMSDHLPSWSPLSTFSNKASSHICPIGLVRFGYHSWPTFIWISCRANSTFWIYHPALDFFKLDPWVPGILTFTSSSRSREFTPVMNRNLNVRKLPGKVGYLLLPPPPHILGHQVIMHHDQNVAMAYNIITQRDTINSQAAPTARVSAGTENWNRQGG
jgi:hypothetical protein